MGEFTRAVLGFPTVLFGGALVVVAGFWTVVLVGGAGFHVPGHHGPLAHHHGGPAATPGHASPAAPHARAHAQTHPASHGSAGHRPHGRGAGPIAALGLDGVPLTVVFSLLTALAWFLSLAGRIALDTAGSGGGPARTAAEWAVLAGALVGAWSGTWLLVRPLRGLFPAGRAPSRDDFVGLLCVVRTGTVTGAFGQAEVTAPDGSAAVVQVRQNGRDPLPAGSSALLYAYEPDGEFFWVAPFADPLDGPPPPGPSAPGPLTGGPFTAAPLPAGPLTAAPPGIAPPVTDPPGAAPPGTRPASTT
ncbi:hypothetical protein [Streptomyces sp. HPF1205]|uniref:hypothetical protein n=1 Tax=Streptomyces sp. HPF1205 TaxID=2873262 RepID=UPI001CEC266F|nr:hypothetical protein [Streptomyces sp. HPF1205]